MQRDCGEWLDAVEKSLPTVVLSAKDGGGHDLFDVTVTVDGRALVEKLDGRALPLDPGAHAFRFELTDGTSVTQQVLVREGDKMHDVAAILQPTRATVSPPLPTAPPTEAEGQVKKPLESDRGRTQRIVGLVAAGAGAVGLGVGAGLGLAAKASDDSAQSETGYARHDDSGSAVAKGNAATAVFVVGGVVLAAGMVVWLTAPRARVVVGTDGREAFLGGRF